MSLSPLCLASGPLTSPLLSRARLGLSGVLLALLVACGGGQNETARSNTERPMAAATALAGGVLINEVSAGSWRGAVDEDGESEDWVELYNPGSAAVDLSGYGLSNKAASPFYWAFPSGTTMAPGSYLTVWLSKKDRAVAGAPLHANFNLDNGGDTVFLSASNATATGILVDRATPPLVNTDQTWCRMPSGVVGAAFSVCEQATFNAANAGPSNAAILSKPVLSPKSGLFATPQTVSITGAAGATLRYTLDGSEPTAASTAYTAPLTVATSQVLRVSAFAAGAAPSLAETGTYVIDAAMASRYGGLKTLMVAMSPADFAAYAANDQTQRFRASFELMGAGGTTVFKLDAEGKAGGGFGSRDSPLRVMNITARDAFGAKAFAGPLWADKPGVTSVKKLRLRNGSNDWLQAHLRDQFSQRTGGTDGPNIYASTSSVAMFLNGRYYGLMEMREREDETLPSSNLALDKDYVDFLSDPLLDGQEIKNGGPAALGSYAEMNAFVTGNDMSVAANYARATSLINPDSLAWDWALHMYHANYDWPYHNVHVWRSPEVDGRWQWQTHDMDFAFGLYTGVGYNMNGSFTEPGSGQINALLKNPGFRNLYLNTVADQLNIMTPAFMTSTLDGMAAEMRPYMADYFVAIGQGSVAGWETRLDELRAYFSAREPMYDSHNRTQFGLGERQPLRVVVNDLAMGSVNVNSVDTRKYITAANPQWSGRYYPGVPITLEAKPKPGYAFVGWTGASTSADRRITQTFTVPAATAFPVDNFSVRWTGSLEAPVSGVAQLQTVADDGVRLWFDGQLVIDNWVEQGPTARVANVNLVAGTRHTLVMEYFEATQGASVKLNWQLPGTAAIVTVPLTQLYPSGAAASPAGRGTGLSASYFSNTSLSGTPVFQREENINFIWDLAGPQYSGPVPTFTAVFAPSGTPAAPVWAAVGAQAFRTGELVNLKVGATDPGAYPITYSATTLPKGLAINPLTGVIFGRLTTPGVYASTLKASNGVSIGSISVTWTITDRPGTGLLGTSPDSGPPTPPSNVAPTASLTAPGANAAYSFGAPIAISASAADTDGTVTRVEFFDGTTLIGTATTAPYAISWTGAGVGAHSLTARAYDNAGASGTSAAVAITVNAVVNVPPTVALSAPGAGASFTSGTAIAISATAADSDGSIARVDFYDGASLIATDTTAPYAASWTGASVGAHSLSARATDNSGAVSSSAAVSITVNAVVVPPTTGTGTGLAGLYFNNTSLSGTAVRSRTEAVNFDWGTAAPGTGVSVDNFSARWTGQVEAPVSGAYQFQTNSDDGVRVWVNGVLLINNWTVHAPTLDTSAAINLVAGQRYSIQVEFVEYSGGATMQLRWKAPGETVFSAVPASRLYTAAAPPPVGGSGTGLLGQYFANTGLSGTVVRQRTEAVNFTWGTASPGTGVPVDNFSVRWSGQVEAPVTGAYQFQTNSDDGVRVWVNGAQIINNWTPHSATLNTSASVNLVAGQRYSIQVEFVEYSGTATLQLLWKAPSDAAFTAIPANRLYSASVPVPAPSGVSPYFGNLSAGTAFIDPVAAGQSLTGVTVRAGSWVNSIRGLAVPANLATHGGTSGTAYTATWPSGEYLVRIYGRASSTGYVGQIRFVTNTGRVLGPYGAATSQFNLTNFDYTVPAGSRILGFAGRANSYVTAIGVVYGP